MVCLDFFSYLCNLKYKDQHFLEISSVSLLKLYVRFVEKTPDFAISNIMFIGMDK